MSVVAVALRLPRLAPVPADPNLGLAAWVRGSTVTRWLPWAVVVFGLALSAVSTSGVAVAGGGSAAVVGAVGTLCVLVVYGWVLLAAVGLVRRRFLGAAVVVLAVAVALGVGITTTPVERYWWVSLAHVVAVAALLTWPGRPGLVVTALAVVFPAVFLISMGLGSDWWASAPVQVVWRTVTVYVLVWLANGLRVLASTNQGLLEVTLAVERTRLDRRLAETVGVALSDLAALGAEIQAAAAQTETTGPALLVLVEQARAAMGDARRLVRSIQHTTVAEELRAIRSLLEAAGIRTVVSVDGVDLGAAATQLRPVLRVQVQDLLARQPPPAACRLTVRHDPLEGYAAWVGLDDTAGEVAR